MSEEAIKAIVKARAIPTLIHFTRTDNLASILEHGILPVASTTKAGIATAINDQYRFDGHLSATSLSIGFPNYRMFYKYRSENAGVDWVVLGIAPSVLWKKDCAFCRHNAADARISRLPIGALKTPEALAGMFEEIDGFPSRQEEKLKPYDPTDVQAEVLVFDVIEPKQIFAAAFETVKAQDAHKSLLGDRKVVVHGGKPGYFSARSYVRR